ncbi:hypothetical protein CU098_002295, partial [Rhizopus stolonifer]
NTLFSSVLIKLHSGLLLGRNTFKTFDTYRLSYFSFLRIKPSFGPNQEIVFSSSLLALWRAHWRLVFDAVPFDVSSIIAQANLLTNKSKQEHLFKNGESPFPPSHVNFNA